MRDDNVPKFVRKLKNKPNRIKTQITTSKEIRKKDGANAVQQPKNSKK